MDGIGDQSAYRRRRHHHGYPIWYFVKAYFMAWAAILIVMALAPPFIIIAYPLAGFMLNRIILQRVKWHKYTTTLGDVASAKIRAIFLWPLEYGVFIVQLLICRFL
jgi:hypothetical protein